MSLRSIYKNKINKFKNVLSIAFGLLVSLNTAFAQPTYTANDKVPEFNAPFGYGVNPGYYGDATDGTGFNREGVAYDIALAQLARNVGMNTWRVSLPAYFFLQYGNSTNLGVNNFNLRSAEFNEYKKLGLLNVAAFIGEATNHIDGPSATTIVGHQYRNLVKYPGCDRYSYEFKNMYEPIWDGGANGTPINDNNYYALYVYKLASKYKGFIKTYEMINEIDFPAGNTVNPSDKSGSKNGNNWFDRNPQPCELLNWRAPIFSYVRMLRIAYEVIKTVDPTAQVAIGGIGFESFLDAVLRNTDNPADGSVTSTYSKKGGAYFDVLNFHHYPQYDLRKKDANGNNVYPFVYLRHSDEATVRTIKRVDDFQAILAKYKYDGVAGNYPKKHFIITEANLPRRTYTGYDWIGSDAAQKNYDVKLMVMAQKKGIEQVHLFTLGERNDITDESNREGHEGLYLNLRKAKRTSATMTSAGRSLQTMTALLDSLTYDPTRTAAMALPATVEGGAFKSATGKYIYVLWAKTTTDNAESSYVKYTFPASLGLTSLYKAEWYFAISDYKSLITTTTVELGASPVYFSNALEAVTLFNSRNTIRQESDSTSTVSEVKENATVTEFKGFPNPFSSQLTFTFNLTKTDVVSLNIFSMAGNQVASVLNNTQLEAGTHMFTLDNQSLPAGVYFGKFVSNSGYKDVIKLVAE